MRVRFDKQSYQLGDTLKCFIVFTNTSDRTIRLLPRDIIFPAAEVHFQSLGTGNFGQLVRLGEIAIDFEELSKQVVVLPPGASYNRTLEAEVRSTFRDSYHDNRRGLILDFPGSALLMPGFGKYRVVKEFKQSPHDYILQYLSAGPPLWSGKVQSPPVFVEFLQPAGRARF